MFLCPVCYYNQMPDPPQDYNICPCCGTEFGYDDEFKSFGQLRSDWIAAGMRWFFRQPPSFWNPALQIAINPFSSEPLTYAHSGLTVSSAISVYGVIESRLSGSQGVPLFQGGSAYHTAGLLAYAHMGHNIVAPVVVPGGDESQPYEVAASAEDFEFELAS
jgi:hypothetical protein